MAAIIESSVFIGKTINATWYVYAMSPCIICFTLSVCNVATPSLLAKTVCNVATWSLLSNKCMQGRHLALPENHWNGSGLHLSLIYQFLNELMKENWHKQHNGFFSELSQGQAYMYMQCRHGPPTTTNIYAMSPPEPCVAKKCMQGRNFSFF